MLRRVTLLCLARASAAPTTFERAVALVAESQANCGADVDLLHARTHVAGFASGIHSVLAALSSALLNGRVLAVQRPKACGRGRGHDFDVACAFQESSLFLPLTACAAEGRTAKASASRFQLTPKALNETKTPSAFVAAARRDGDLRDQPPYFWAAAVAAYATRPRACLASHVAGLRAALFPGVEDLRAVLSIHARIGEKDKEAILHNWKEYANAAIAISNERGFADVLVCSDRKETHGAISQALRGWRPVRVADAYAYEPTKRAACDDRQAAAIAAEILLMARTGHVVGTFSSNVGRLVHALMLADRNPDGPPPLESPPFFDLDGLSSWWIAGDGPASCGRDDFREIFQDRENDQPS
jgi:hypothetical protein